jgi:hypothetical protein
VTQQLHRALRFELAEATPIDPGVIHNNRLFRLRGADGRELVAKLYYRDDRRRLEREYGAFRFLRDRGFAGVPIPYFADAAEQWAVYSFEPGRTKAPAELTRDEFAGIGRLAAELHRFRPGEPGADIPPAFASGPLAERVAFLRGRLATCQRAAAAPDAYPQLRAVVAEVDLAPALEHLIAAATAGLTAGEIEAPVPPEHLRLNPGDFAPHNVIVRPDATLCAIDFEFCGWEEAALLAASFLTAEQSVGLTTAQEQEFLGAYLAACDVPAAALARFDRLRALLEAGWLLVNLSLMTPAHVARKRFAGDFDLDAHLAERRAMIEARLARLEAGVGGQGAGAGAFTGC